MSYQVVIEGLDVSKKKIPDGLSFLPKEYNRYQILFFHGEADILGSDSGLHDNPKQFKAERDSLILAVKYSLVNRGQAITSECESFNEAILFAGDIRIGSAALANAQAIVASGVLPCSLSYERTDGNLNYPVIEDEVIKVSHSYDGYGQSTQRPAYHVYVYLVSR